METEKSIAQQFSDYLDLNDTGDMDMFTLWSAHKTFLRGILI